MCVTEKHLALLDYILESEHDSEFVRMYADTEERKNYNRKHVNRLNMPIVWQEYLALISNLIDVDDAGKDYNDGSDCKTGSITESNKEVMIANIQSKIGALRVTIYNGITKQLNFFYFPYSVWKEWEEDFGKYTKTSNTSKTRIRTYWGETTKYGSWNFFECETAKELAYMTDEKMKKKIINRFGEYNPELWHKSRGKWIRKNGVLGKLNKNNMKKLCELRNKKVHVKEITKKFNVSQSTVYLKLSQIKQGIYGSELKELLNDQKNQIC